jgi:hypothetical protein
MYGNFTFNQGECPGTEKECWFGEFVLRKQPYIMTFYYHPSDVENIPVEPDTLRVAELREITNHTVFIAVPQNAPGTIGVAAVELSRVLGTANNLLNLNVKGAAWGDVTCENASGKVIVISIEQAAVDSVTFKQPNCIQIGATSDERAIAVADAYSYRLLTIIPTYIKPSNATLPR